MSNAITTVGHDIKVGIEDVFKSVPKVISVLSTAQKDAPAVKNAVLGLVSQFTAPTTAGSAAVASDGTNVIADVATLSAGEAFIEYFERTFLPEVEAVYKEVKQDIAG